MKTIIRYFMIWVIIPITLSCDCDYPSYKIKELKVCYLKGHIDALNTMNCESVKEAESEIKIDTIISDRNQLQMVEAAIKGIHKYKTENNCDIRLVCDLTFIDNRKLQICLSDRNVLWNNDTCFKDNNLQYSIKSISGYYNYFNKQDLSQYFPEIIEFGIPKNYKYIDSNPFRK